MWCGLTTTDSPRAAPWKGAAVVLAMIVLLLAYGGLSASTGGGGAPLPFDPLLEVEEEQAIAIARTSPLIDLPLVRYETIGAALNTDKEWMRQAQPPRMADVWFYIYTTDMAVHVIVDLGRGAIVSQELGLYQPPLTTREIVHASELALADADVQAKLAPRLHHGEVEPMARLWTGDTADSCPVHRCALVGFHIGDEYQADLFVRVNLSLDVVEAILEPAHSNIGTHTGVDH